MIRLFVGIPLPEEVRQHLHLIQGGLEGAHWINPASMHVTLRFIGEIDEVQAGHVDEALREIHEPAFDMSLSRLDVFGRGHRVHTLWAGIDAGPELGHLQGKVERAVVQAGLDAQRRKFSPHVTLAKVKKSPKGKVAEWLAGHGGLATEAFTVDKFILYRSHLGHNGAHYEDVAEYFLESKPA